MQQPVEPRKRAARVTRMSLPHEHGGYIALAGSSVTATVIAPSLAPAFGVALAVAMGFCARGPVERMAARLALRAWDPVALLVMGLVAGFGIFLVATTSLLYALAGAAVALSIPFIGYVARRSRKQRHELFELVGMTFLGGSAGVIALAGGTSLATAAIAGGVLAVHAGTSIPIVRTELRRGERSRATLATVTSAIALVCAGGLILLVGAALTVLALLPRTLHLFVRLYSGPSEARPMMVGIRELALLSVASLIVVFTL